jgi:hypothetical protein
VLYMGSFRYGERPKFYEVRRAYREWRHAWFVCIIEGVIKIPRATVDLTSTEKHELKSLPGAYVVLRRLSYGDKLRRSDMYMQMQMSMSGKGTGEANMQLMSEKVAQFEFARCVVEHNLEDEDGRALDFKSPADVIRLDPRVGEEINNFLSDMNNFDETDAAKNFNSESDQP